MGKITVAGTASNGMPTARYCSCRGPTMDHDLKGLMSLYAHKFIGDYVADQPVVPGNINLLNRPVVYNPEEGGYSTVRTYSWQTEDGLETVVPTVTDDGRIVHAKEAKEIYYRTGRHLGKFRTSDAAERYAEELHKAQLQVYRHVWEK